MNPDHVLNVLQPVPRYMMVYVITVLLFYINAVAWPLRLVIKYRSFIAKVPIYSIFISYIACMAIPPYLWQIDKGFYEYIRPIVNVACIAVIYNLYMYSFFRSRVASPASPQIAGKNND